MSDFVQHNAAPSEFDSSDSWVILTPIEQSIKRKIEAVGVPLKDWDIQINYGIKTGFNDAFIVTTETRNTILANCADEDERQRTEELIRPILRGRDIKRYGYDWAGLWLIWIPWHFPLHLDPSIKGASKKAEEAFKSHYPAVYHHLYQYKEELSARNKAETGIRYEWYALQRWGANYLDDFSKPKIVYPETTQGAYFAIDSDGQMADKTCFIMITKYPLYLQSILSSRLYELAYKRIFSSIELGESAYQYNKHALIKLPVIPTSTDQKYNDNEIYIMYNITDEEIRFIESQYK